MSASTKYIEKWTVIDEDLDELDHVNNLQYLRWTLKADLEKQCDSHPVHDTARN